MTDMTAYEYEQAARQDAADTPEAPESVQDVITRMGITVESVFVPWSRSRSKDAKQPSLNWRVTVKRNGTDVLTTDYMAGMAHCPGYNKPVPSNWGKASGMWRPTICAAECETGMAMRASKWLAGAVETLGGRPGSSGKPVRIEPDMTDVVYSLVMDASVLDAGGYADWAADFGYDADSIAGEDTYKACLEIALQMRAAFGSAGLDELATAFQDY